MSSANLNLMMKVARKAGRSLAKDFREVEQLQVSSKSAGDFVSLADIRAEEIIRQELMEARPTYGWLGEESGAADGKDPTRRWIVDPLDGTTNFLHGLPHFAVSIALEHKGDIVAGVIYDPSKDECFAAEKGQGAFVNEARLRVSDRKSMIESIFATGLPFAGRPELPDQLKRLAKLLPACAGVRRFGSAALDMAYVAAGRYDGYWEGGLNAWDIAAGIIIVKEAGGFIEPIDPQGNILEDGALICANDPMFPQLAKVIRSV